MTESLSEPILRSHLEDGVLTLSLHRPAARNALSIDLVRQLKAALEAFEQNPDARAAIITGEGTAFCAGLDLKDFSAPDAPRAEVGDLIRWIPYVSKPVIAAVNGAAMTGGLELVLACDFALAADTARFGDTHLRIGALSGSGMNSRLPQAVGLRWAKQMVFSCQPINAETALAIGLVNEVHPADTLLVRAQELARHIASWDPELVAIAKTTMNQGAEATLTDAMQIESEALAARKAKGAMSWKS